MKTHSPSFLRSPLAVCSASFLLLATALCQDIFPLPVAASTEWAMPEKKITSLTEFFSRLPEMEMPETGMKRMLMAKVESTEVSAEGDAAVIFRIPPEEFPMFLPSRDSTRLQIPLNGMGNPFVSGQTWSLFFDKDGKIARLQWEGTMTHYRKRSDGFVEVRLHDAEGHTAEFVPTTVMPPEAEMDEGFFSYVDLFRDAGLVAGHDAVGGPGSLELESIALPDLEATDRNGLAPDSAPWIDIRTGGMATAIPDTQRFAY